MCCMCIGKCVPFHFWMFNRLYWTTFLYNFRKKNTFETYVWRTLISNVFFQWSFHWCVSLSFFERKKNKNLNRLNRLWTKDNRSSIFIMNWCGVVDCCLLDQQIKIFLNDIKWILGICLCWTLCLHCWTAFVR